MEALDWLQAWEECRTGFPWIDAIMAQLHQWGWMHHLARHCVVRDLSCTLLSWALKEQPLPKVPGSPFQKKVPCHLNLDCTSLLHVQALRLQSPYTML